MKLWLTRFGLWIARFGYWPSTALTQRARVLCTIWDKPDLSGEYKRHQVLASLIKEFPGISHKTLALAIELALSAYGH